jgi:hypothetical protein
VERLRTSVETNAVVPTSPLARGATLLLAWHVDARYSNGFTGPNALPYKSAPPELSFTSLAAEFAPEVEPNTFLAELVAAGSVVYDADRDLYRACERTFFHYKFSTAAAEYLAYSLSHLAETLSRNLRTDERDSRLVERTVYTSVPATPATEAAFREFIKLNGQKFLETVDEWFKKQPRAAQAGRRLGVQLFQYVEEDHEPNRPDGPTGMNSGTDPTQVRDARAPRRPHQQ